MVKDVRIFKYRDYTAFLNDYFLKKGSRSGLKANMAKSLNCQSAYLSKVLKEEADFSLEQAISAADFLGFTSSETDYFVLLVQYKRAGTKKLKDFLNKKIKTLLKEQKNIKKKISIECPITDQDRSIYYGHWSYVAIHMLVAIGEFQTIDALTKHLNLSRKQIKDSLDFLEEKKLIAHRQGIYKTGVNHIHLEKESLFSFHHHKNWRLKAINELENRERNNLHYTVITSLSKKDAEVLKEKIVQLIDDNLKIIAPSKEEVTYCNIIDFFPI